jgi:DNA-binding GntR family transcriptional regulator
VLREEIRDRLIEEILGGHLVPGDRLVETRIASGYGVSQAPVREALRDLELLGFVVSAPFRAIQPPTFTARSNSAGADHLVASLMARQPTRHS